MASSKQTAWFARVDRFSKPPGSLLSKIVSFGVSTGVEC